MWNWQFMKNRSAWFLKKILKGWAGDSPMSSLPQEVDAPADKEVKVDDQAKQVQEYEPKPGQPGKDVQWVPGSLVVINRMLNMAKVTPEDYVIDLGSGDGRMAISAAKLGAQALGVEYNPRMIELARKNAAIEGVSDKATFIQADLFKTDFSMATVLALFLREDINVALRPKILDMKPGTRIVSNIFHMREWKADEVVQVEDENYYFKNHTVYFWVVPAKVEGTWKLPQGELKLDQNFQMINGALYLDNVTTPVSGRMTGDRITFIADGRQYTGRITGNRMEVETNDGSNLGWTATLPEA
jgi:SAM-dependent methyltransferase